MREGVSYFIQPSFERETIIDRVLKNHSAHDNSFVFFYELCSSIRIQDSLREAGILKIYTYKPYLFKTIELKN